VVVLFTGRTSKAEIHPTAPVNATVSAGTTVKLSCETDTDSTIRWDLNGHILYSNFTVRSSFAWKMEVNDTGRWNELTLKNVGADDVGVYSCHEVKKFSRMVSFTLAIAGKLLSACHTLAYLE